MKNWKRKNPSSYCFLNYDKLYIDNRLFVYDKELNDVVEQDRPGGGGGPPLERRSPLDRVGAPLGGCGGPLSGAGVSLAGGGARGVGAPLAGAPLAGAAFVIFHVY